MPLYADSYMEYAQSGIQPQKLKKLRRGEIPWENYIDLHQMTVETAQPRLHRFVKQAHHQGQRVLLIIHGKGLNTMEPYPVLKNEVNDWLRQMTEVIAFCSALPRDGGCGAVYILLKSNKRSRHE